MILKKNNGFTLIEVIISIAIIAIIGVILSNLVSTTVKSRNISYDRLKILALCTSYMNEIKSLQDGFSSIDDIEALLEENDFAKEINIFKKAEAANINIQIHLNEKPDEVGLYEVMITGQSPNVSEISISTVIRGGD